MQFHLFDRYPSLVIAFSTRAGGQMKLGASADAEKNRERFLLQNDVSPKSVIAAEIVHGSEVVVVQKSDAGTIIRGADGLFTNEKNLFLSITAADCLPVFIFDPEQQVVGLIHAGWRGLAAGILHHAFITNPSSILVAIGPAIGQHHFEVKEDVVEKFTDFPEALAQKSGKYFLDLKKIAYQQLLQEKILPEHIEIDQTCTFCAEQQYFSFRRDKPAVPEAMIAVCGIRGAG